MGNLIAFVPRNGFTVTRASDRWVLRNRAAYGSQCVLTTWPKLQHRDAFVHCCRLNGDALDEAVVASLAST